MVFLSSAYYKRIILSFHITNPFMNSLEKDKTRKFNIGRKTEGTKVTSKKIQWILHLVNTGKNTEKEGRGTEEGLTEMRWLRGN